MYTDISVFKEQYAYTPCMSIFTQSSDYANSQHIYMHTHHVCQYLYNQVTMLIHNTIFWWWSLWCHCSRLYSSNWYNSITCSRADNHIKAWKSSGVPETDLSPRLQGANDGLVKPILVTRCSNVQCVCLRWAKAQGGLGAPLVSGVKVVPLDLCYRWLCSV